MFEMPNNLPSEPCSYFSETPTSPAQRKLWRTWLKRPRPLQHFRKPIELDPRQVDSDPDLAAQCGEHILLDDYLLVLHRDGSLSYRHHLVTQLHSSEALAAWDEVLRTYDSDQCQRFQRAMAQTTLSEFS